MTPEERRTREIQERLADHADAIVLFPSRNLQYLAGHYEEPGERHTLLFVPRDGEPTFLVPELSAAQIDAATWVSDVRSWADADDPREAVREIVTERDLTDGHLLVDDTMHARFTHDLRAVCPDASFGLASELLGSLRVRKDETEIDALRRAGRAADAVIDDLREWGSDVIGTTETALARHVADRLADHGGRGVSFETIVGSGPNGAMPHHTHGDREIRPGDPVVLDFGTRVDGYPSDQTRTLVFDGEPSDRFREVHEIVREAQAAAVAAVEPGVTAGAVDRAAREVIEAAGYGEQFVHRTGHGVGLDVHEEPFVVRGSDRRVEPGMVFSVEPGIYCPDEFGVRIEDLVVVTEDGCERLNETDRGWQC